MARVSFQVTLEKEPPDVRLMINVDHLDGQSGLLLRRVDQGGLLAVRETRTKPASKTQEFHVGYLHLAAFGVTGTSER